MKAMMGPMLPTTRDQKMAGLWREAHLMYRDGFDQKATGAIVKKTGRSGSGRGYSGCMQSCLVSKQVVGVCARSGCRREVDVVAVVAE